MKLLSRIFIMLFTLTFVFSSTIAMGADLNTPSDMAALQELNISMSGEPSTLDFSFSATSADIDVYNYIMEGLTRNSSKGMADPGIASSWEISEDGKVWTFHLRDAKWSDGVEVTAQQFKDGWLRALNPEKPSNYAFSMFDILNAEDYSTGKVASEAVGIAVINSKALKVTLKTPITYFDSLVSMPVFSPIRLDRLSENGQYNTDKAKLVSNGPFFLSSWDTGKSIVFEKNPEYWDNSHIYLKKFTGYIFSDITYMDKIDMYQKGSLDVLDYVDSTSYKAIGKNNIQSYLDGSVWYLSYNCSDKVLKNKNIRKALSYSIDRTKFLNGAYPLRKYLPATAIVSPEAIPDPIAGTFRAAAPSLFKDHDSAAAKEFFKQGLSELNIKKLPTITLLVNKTVLGIQGGDILAATWKSTLGIKVAVKAVTQEERLQKLSASKYQITLDGWGPDYPDPMTYLNIFTTSNPMSYANYSNPDYDALVQSAKATVGKTEKFEIMHRAEALLMEDMPVCPLYFRKSNYSVKGYVANVESGAFAPNINFLHSYIRVH